MGAARIQVLGEAFDRAALARGVPAFEEDYEATARGFDPLLQLQQFDLQQPLFHLILFPGHSGPVGVALAPGVDRRALGGQQDRVIVIFIQHGEAVAGQVKNVHRANIRCRHERYVNKSREGSARTMTRAKAGGRNPVADNPHKAPLIPGLEFTAWWTVYTVHSPCIEAGNGAGLRHKDRHQDAKRDRKQLCFRSRFRVSTQTNS